MREAFEVVKDVAAKERDKRLLRAAAGLDEKLLDGGPLLAGGRGTLLGFLHGHPHVDSRVANVLSE